MEYYTIYLTLVTDFGAPIFRTVYYKELLQLFQPLMSSCALQYLLDMQSTYFDTIFSVFN
ncbi:hypothetical protein M917_1527 [Psychrobacter aquaticus CMS 56]|uniref:Uncharacterized protein n=1 Tax=Psychrobacter aquaticus CMS 56 TaxID=1354303 RepID=U4T319_9GAMM|nr:hypothetical protein M917_1527 [Psychrobacter aquaticus CMS 56]